MKVLMISDVYFPHVNGVSTSMQTFRKELGNLGVDVTLAVPDYGSNQEPDESIVRIPSSRVLLDPEDRMMSYGAAKNVAKMLPERDYDLIHIQTPFVAHYAGCSISRELGIPSVTTYHTYFEEYFHHYIPFLPAAWLKGAARRFSRKQCEAVDAIVVPSHAMAKTLLDYGVKMEMHIIPTGIPEEMFAGGDAEGFRKEQRIEEGRKILLFVGRVAFEKSIGFLIRAAQIAKQEVPGLLLLIAGEGPAEDSLKRLTSQAGMNEHVRFIGYLDRKDRLKDCYAAADAFVFASRTETQGLVLLEAMAAAKPVISTAFMGTKDILTEESGAIVPEEDENEFAAAMVRVLQDEELRKEMSGKSLRHAMTWRSGAMAEKMARLYAGLTGKIQTMQDLG